MTRIFVDSSVFIAAMLSARGYAFDLVMRVISAQYTLLVSPDVLAETERNIRLKVPHAYPRFEDLRATIIAETIAPTDATVRRVAGIIHAKDEAILAAAIDGHATWLATYDRKHLLAQRAVVLDAFGVTIDEPGEIITALAG